MESLRERFAHLIPPDDKQSRDQKDVESGPEGEADEKADEKENELWKKHKAGCKFKVKPEEEHFWKDTFEFLRKQKPCAVNRADIFERIVKSCKQHQEVYDIVRTDKTWTLFGRIVLGEHPSWSIEASKMKNRILDMVACEGMTDYTMNLYMVRTYGHTPFPGIIRVAASVCNVIGFMLCMFIFGVLFALVFRLVCLAFVYMILPVFGGFFMFAICIASPSCNPFAMT